VHPVKACDVARLDMGDLDDPKKQEELRKALAAGEHEMQKILWESGLSFGDVDLHLKPIAAKASGLQSPLHTAVKFTDRFATAYDPLALSPNWTSLNSKHTIYTTGAPTNRAKNKSTSGSERWGVDSASGYVPTDENYSVEVVSFDHYTSSSNLSEPGVCSRIVDNLNFYRSQCCPCYFGKELIRPRIRRDNITLAAKSYTTPGAHKVRHQVTGTGDDIAIVYFRDGAEILSATGLHEDYQLNGKGTAGLVLYLGTNTPADQSYYEAFKCYEAAGGARGLDAGAFGLGRGGRGLSPNAGGLQ